MLCAHTSLYIDSEILIKDPHRHCRLLRKYLNKYSFFLVCFPFPSCYFLCACAPGNKAQKKVGCGEVFKPMPLKEEENKKKKEKRVEENKENHLKSPRAEEQDARQWTVFEKAFYDLMHLDRGMNDLLLGRRVAFYELRGEIGFGNFAQVRLGIHDLTKGEIFEPLFELSLLYLVICKCVIIHFSI